MARARKGTLEHRKSGWHCRLTVNVEGESVRKWFPLDTDDKQIARLRMKRMIKEHANVANVDLDKASSDATRVETYKEAAERIRAAREVEGVEDMLNERNRDELYFNPAIGHLLVTEVRAKHIRTLLEEAARRGRLDLDESAPGYKPRPSSRGTLERLRGTISVVFDRLWREEVIENNPVKRAQVPRVQHDNRERAVLTDEELVIYLGWEHPQKRFQKAVLQRQVMSVLTRTFGGLRAGDLHALKWEALETEDGRFGHGWVTRKKTKRSQKLEVPEVLRPYLRNWWQRHGRPSTGVVFPSLRGSRVGEAKKRGGSHAAAFRRDLQRAFKASQKCDNTHTAPVEGSRRWRELFEDTEHTRRVDFHSWRRAYVQALADADINAQQAATLAGHSNLAAHGRYLANTAKARKLPDGAVPDLGDLESSAARTFEGEVDSNFEPQVADIVGRRDRGRTCDVRRVKAADIAISGEKQTHEVARPPTSDVMFPHVLEARTIAADDSMRDIVRAVDSAIGSGDLAEARALVADLVCALEAGLRGSD